MGKIIVYIIFALFLASFAVAGDTIGQSIGSGVKNVLSIIENTLGPIFVAILGGTETMLFERILILAILMSIVYLVASNTSALGGDTEDNKYVIWTVTITVSVLATRFLADTKLLKTIILPYSVLGVTLSSIIPFILFWFFIEKFENSIVRKIGWIFFTVIFIGLWAARSEELGGLAWIYLITAILSFFFLLFDGTIRDLMVKAERRAWELQTKESHLAKLREELRKLREQERDWSNPKAFRRAVRDLEKRIRRAEKVRF